MKSILFFLTCLFFVFSLESKTIVSLSVPTESETYRSEIESSFRRVHWEELSFSKDPSVSAWDYKLNISTAENSFMLQFFSKGNPEPIYSSSTPLSLKKNSLETFEKFLAKRKFQDDLLHSQMDPSPKVKLFSNKNQFQVGDPMELGFETLEKGYVYLLLFSEKSEESVLLYPNDSQKEKELPANTKILLGSAENKLLATKPLGKEIVKAFHFSKPWNQLKLKKIPGSRFHWYSPKLESLKKNPFDPNSELTDRIESSSDLSWEIIAK